MYIGRLDVHDLEFNSYYVEELYDLYKNLHLCFVDIIYTFYSTEIFVHCNGMFCTSNRTF